MFPDGNGISITVKRDLGSERATRIIGLDKRCRAPASPGNIPVRPDVGPCPIGLSPHGNGISSLIKRELGIEGIPRIIGLDKPCRAPASPGNIAVRPDVIPCPIELIPHSNGIPIPVISDLRRDGKSRIINLDKR